MFYDFFKNSLIDVIKNIYNIHENKIELNLDNYMKIRYYDFYTLPSILILEYIHNMNIPKCIHQDKSFINILHLSSKHMFIINDIISYNYERKNNKGINNIIDIYKRDYNLNIENAMIKVIDNFYETENELLILIPDMIKKYPNYEKLLKKYYKYLLLFVGGNYFWHIQSPRYKI